MYFEDLAPLLYCGLNGGWQVPLLAVGWLEHPHPVPGGNVPADLLDHIRRLKQKPFGRFMGLHGCSLCWEAGVRPFVRTILNDSSLVFYVPGDGVVYGVPGGVDHYITTHAYAPPGAFAAAAAACPDPGTPEYRHAFRAANAGIEAPFWRNSR